MNEKIQFTNFEPKESEKFFLKSKMNDLFVNFPEVSNYKIKISFEENNYRARMSAKYNKVDVTSKFSCSALLITLNKLTSNFEDKLIMMRNRYRITQLPRIGRNSIFEYSETHRNY